MKNVLVTGAGGFVGKALCQALIARGITVRGIARRSYPELTQIGVQMSNLDLSEVAVNSLASCLSGIDTIFHVASKVEMWGKFQDFYATNVEGTRKLLEAAKKCGVRRFIYTSSPSVVSRDGDISGSDESLPYPVQYLSHYPATKAEAERLVLQSNGSDLYTIALRPHLIFGPGDTHLTKTLIERARSGKLLQVGDGKNLVDFSYIDDCVAAHIQAGLALENNPAAGGRPYFISQGEPYLLWKFVEKILAGAGVQYPKRKISYSAAYSLASALEFAFKLFRIKKEPPLTRFLVSQMAHSHYFSISAARKELLYEPKISVEEGILRTFDNSRMRDKAINENHFSVTR